MGNNTSLNDIEADIAASRDRLARTIDELSERATPKAIVARQKADAKARFASATTDEAGQVRDEIIGAVAALGIALVVIGLVRRSRS